MAFRYQLVSHELEIVTKRFVKEKTKTGFFASSCELVYMEFPFRCVSVDTQSPNLEYQPYSVPFLENIRDSIMQDDVRSPLVAVLNELNAQSGVRRSAYREILFMVMIALGKDSIDCCKWRSNPIATALALSRTSNFLAPQPPSIASTSALTTPCNPPKDRSPSSATVRPTTVRSPAGLCSANSTWDEEGVLRSWSLCGNLRGLDGRRRRWGSQPVTVSCAVLIGLLC